MSAPTLWSSLRIQKTYRGFNRDGSNGMSYVTHLPGGDQLLLVIPIRQSEGGVDHLA